MENKILVEYGPREADIFADLIENKKIPSKNEAFRRGLFALDYLMSVDLSSLFKMLADSLEESAKSVKDMRTLSQRLAVSRILAHQVVATSASQKGILVADQVDIFRAAIDEFFALIQTDSFKSTDKEKLSFRLSTLSEFANQFYKKELKYSTDRLPAIPNK